MKKNPPMTNSASTERSLKRRQLEALVEKEYQSSLPEVNALTERQYRNNADGRAFDRTEAEREALPSVQRMRRNERSLDSIRALDYKDEALDAARRRDGRLIIRPNQSQPIRQSTSTATSDATRVRNPMIDRIAREQGSMRKTKTDINKPD